MDLILGSFQGRPTKSFNVSDRLDKDGELEIYVVDIEGPASRYLSRDDMVKLRDHLQELLDGV